jgi:hypothetical protein
MIKRLSELRESCMEEMLSYRIERLELECKIDKKPFNKEQAIKDWQPGAEDIT